MTKEEIDILWNKAMRLSIEDGDQFTRYRFAELVVAAERDSWPAEMEAMERQVNILTDALAQAKAEEREKWMERTAILIRGEREACAKVCADMYLEGDMDTGLAAEAIRARSNT